MLEPLIVSRTRIKMLVKFFVTPANSGYLNQLANEFNESTNSVRRELNKLAESNYLIRWNTKNKIVYAANVSHPLFFQLQQMVHTHLGFDKIISVILDRIPDVHKIILIGDYAFGRDTGVVEIIILANVIQMEYINSLQVKMNGVVNRTVKFYINAPVKNNGMVLYEKKSETTF